MDLCVRTAPYPNSDERSVRADRHHSAAGEANCGDELALVRGRTGWIISDGKVGNDAQTKGVADALGLAYETKLIDPGGVWRLLSPWGPVSPAEGFGTARSQFR